MVKTQLTNTNRRTPRYGLLLAAWMVVAPGCAGMPNTEPRSTWPELGGAVDRGPAATSAADAQPAAAPPPVTVRSQGGWDTNDTLPGSDAHTRYPMPASGSSGDSQQYQVTGQVTVPCRVPTSHSSCRQWAGRRNTAFARRLWRNKRKSRNGNSDR